MKVSQDHSGWGSQDAWPKGLRLYFTVRQEWECPVVVQTSWAGDLAWP